MSADAASESPGYLLGCIDGILPDIAEDHASAAVLSQVGIGCSYFLLSKLLQDGS